MEDLDVTLRLIVTFCQWLNQCQWHGARIIKGKTSQWAWIYSNVAQPKSEWALGSIFMLLIEVKIKLQGVYSSDGYSHDNWTFSGTFNKYQTSVKRKLKSGQTNVKEALQRYLHANLKLLKFKNLIKMSVRTSQILQSRKMNKRVALNVGGVRSSFC